MKRFLKSWFARESANKPTRNKTRLGMETLEGRELCAVGGLVVNYELQLQATNGGDTFTAHYAENDPSTPLDDEVNVTWKHGNKTENLSFGAYKLVRYGDNLVPERTIRQLKFIGGNGNDTFHNDTNLTSYQYGNKGNDKLNGGSNRDYLMGGLGSDTLYGGWGDDLLFAQDVSGLGNEKNTTDRLFGGEGWDELHGARGSVNYLYGEKGSDKLYGGEYEATNFMFGGEDGDRYFCGAGNPSKPKRVHNHVVDTTGYEWISCGDYANNFIFVVDGKPLANPGNGSWDDTVYKSKKGNDTIYFDPEIKYGNEYYGDNVSKKSW